ncbi:MAG: phosphatase PAP2 family protein [Hyphomicrobiales bacterium]|nr:phosphatase PAP2 family protein [Hyphomicrobiales bacterium]MBV8825126.1 phosphatase PAP2 family protein [Hyphomicrobiales bacterium]MBV9427017.1 phosphatase PAP2 family protein [Bradyrhizobiaceae bacterium]
MSYRAPISLPPTRADLAVARVCAHHVTPAIERTLKTLTWAADEKVILASTAAFWAASRAARCQEATKRRADHMLAGALIASALPHVMKRLVRRRRPDRTVVHRERHGVPRSGNAWDSFPSGHALHLGALARDLHALSPPALRPLLWPALAGLAASRMLLLAHYPSDVIGGLALGATIDAAVAAVIPPPDREG